MSVIVLLALSCGPVDGAPGHPIAGTVLEVADDRVVLDHDPIDGVMPAMVMELMVPRPIPLHRGDRIEGRLIIGDGPSRLEAVRIVGRSDLEPPPAKRWDATLLVGEVLERTTVDTTSGPARLGEGHGQVTVLTFLFTRCPVPEVCPLLVTKLAALQHRIGSARIVAVTLDPEHDTLPRLAEYGARVGADPAVWTFGRFERDPLGALLSRIDIDVERQGDTLTHDLRLLVLDAEGRLVHRERDNAWEVDALAAVVRAAAPAAD